MPGLRRSRAAGALAALAAAVLTVALSAPSARAAGPTIGPVQINPVGHPRLCWQAGGNGSGVTLERCDPALQGQQWSLTSDGVVMNGNGYCLEAGPATALYIDFAGQCAGSGPGPGPQAGRTWPGLAVPGRTAGQCRDRRLRRSRRPGRGRCPDPPAALPGRLPLEHRVQRRHGRARPRRRPRGPDGGTFTASVTVADAASAQAAYGVAVTFSLPPHLSASGLHVTGAAGWTCDVRRVTCTGTLPSGASGKVMVTGRLPAAARPALLRRPGPRRRDRHLPAPRRAQHHLCLAGRPGAPRPATPRCPIRSALLLIAVAAAVLLLAGALLIYITRRRPRHAARSRPRSRSHRMPQ